MCFLKLCLESASKSNPSLVPHLVPIANSPYDSYCSLLTRGLNLQQGTTSYPSTAPDALRHWTPSQKTRLEQSENGKKLVEVETKQQEDWKEKYASLGASDRQNMNYEQFEWSMEAVNSRAFRGDFGGKFCIACGLFSPLLNLLQGIHSKQNFALQQNPALDGGEGGPLRKIASLLLPLSALAFGIIYATDPSMDKYFLPLSIMAATPVILTVIADQKGSKEAVMLPLIDSANHLQEADSVIEYDPAVDGFVLSLGRKCLVKERDGDEERAQVCISYGVRKDSELLLNYGFLRGVSMEGLKNDEGDESRDAVRQRLAETFVSRN